MSVTEGIGKPIGYALVIGGAIFAAWYLLKDFDWGSLVPKGVSETVTNITNYTTHTYNVVTGNEAASVEETTWEKYERETGVPLTGEQKGSDLAYDVAAAWQGVDTTGEYNKPWWEYITDMLFPSQNANTAPAPALPEAITYTSEEMATMSAGLTSSPGSGYVQRGTSLTGAPLFKVGPWKKVGYVEDVAGGQIPIWRNPVDGSLDVTQSPATGGIGLATFRMHNQDWKVVI